MLDASQVEAPQRLPPATWVCFGLFSLPKPEGESRKVCVQWEHLNFLFKTCKMESVTSFPMGSLHFQATELLVLLCWLPHCSAALFLLLFWGIGDFALSPKNEHMEVEPMSSWAVPFKEVKVPSQPEGDRCPDHKGQVWDDSAPGVFKAQTYDCEHWGYWLISLTISTDIFALVRYEQQNDNYR